MSRRLALSSAAALCLAVPAGMAPAANEAITTDYAFSFEGPFGTYDQNAIQRGLQIYTEICSSCHGLRYVPIRTLTDEDGPGLPDDQMRAYAEQFYVMDPEANPDLIDPETGEPRELRPTDHFPANESQNAPDMSLIAKARLGFHGPYGTALNNLFNGIGGPEYVASLMTGYVDEPECAFESDPMDGWYNVAFPNGALPPTCYDEAGNAMVPGSYISMAPPLYGQDVDYNDGAPNDLQSEAMDVAQFLMWTAEPHMMDRKRMGLTAIIMLGVLAVLLYLTNKQLWAPVKAASKRRKDADSPAE